jgi:hypothetical protein
MPTVRCCGTCQLWGVRRGKTETDRWKLCDLVPVMYAHQEYLCERYKRIPGSASTETQTEASASFNLVP